MGADLRAQMRAAVEPDASATRRPVAGDAAGVGAEAVGGVLGGDPALHRSAMHLQRILTQPKVFQRLPVGDAHLAGDQVDVGDLLGDGVLDLDARIHLDEDVVAALVQQEFDGARVGVVDLAGERDGVGADLLPQFVGQVRRGGQFDDLLVPALHAAVPFEEVHHIAVGVGQDLHLDVTRVDDGLLKVQRRVTERGLGFAGRRPRSLRAAPAAVGDAPHAAPAAARHRLDEQRELHRRAAAISSSTDADGADEFSTGNPAARAAAIARDLLPVSSRISALGPTNVMPAAAHAAARSGFSDRKPYPG